MIVISELLSFVFSIFFFFFLIIPVASTGMTSVFMAAEMLCFVLMLSRELQRMVASPLNFSRSLFFLSLLNYTSIVYMKKIKVMKQACISFS